MLKLTVKESLQRLGEEKALYATLFCHGSLEIEIYKPLRIDLQGAHNRDEVYVVASGTSQFRAGKQDCTVGQGDVLFVPAGMDHRFSRFTEDFSTFVFFYGPSGGERP